MIRSDRRVLGLLLALVAAGAVWWYARTPRGRVFVEAVAERVAPVVEWTYRKLTLGFRNNNPGNIRFIADPARAWNGQVGNNRGYGVYENVPLGVRAIGRQLLVYARRGLVSVRQIGSTWAPPSENKTDIYVRNLARALRVDPDAPIDVRARLPEIAAQIIRQENGEQPYPVELIKQWVYS